MQSQRVLEQEGQAPCGFSMRPHYSLEKNLLYMAMAFSRPRSLINRLLTETSAWYGVLPYLLAFTLYEGVYAQQYLVGYQQAAAPFPPILPIPADQYELYRIFCAPLVRTVDVFIFWGTVVALSRLLRIRQISPGAVVTFFLLIGGTYALAALVVDLLALLLHSYNPLTWGLVHPLVGLIDTAYVIAFTHRQAGIPLWKAMVLGLSSMIGAIAFIALFLR